MENRRIIALRMADSMVDLMGAVRTTAVGCGRWPQQQQPPVGRPAGRPADPAPAFWVKTRIARATLCFAHARARVAFARERMCAYDLHSGSC